MAKLLSMLAKMKLVNVEGTGPDPTPAVQPVPEPTADGQAAGIEPGLPPVEVDEVPHERFEDAVSSSGDEQVSPEDFPFDRIYVSAGIVEPGHGFTVYTLMEMIEAEEMQGLDPATTARIIGGLLRRLPSGAVDIHEIVSDAAHRDRALDSFEGFLRDRVERTDQEIAEANRVLQDEIDEITRRNSELMEANRTRAEGEHQRLHAWLERKHGEEQRLYDAVAPFVEANPVTAPEDEPQPE